MKKILLVVLMVALGVSLFFPAQTFAKKAGDACKCADGRDGHVVVDTAILDGCDCSENSGDNAIREILSRVVDTMSIGIGILGVIGISVVGIQYLTAGGSEEKARKAKRRMYEIVIGLAAYVLIYALLKWLMPSA
ncbi:hypothetical protein IKG33_02460 [Candidatus Saccharibacteria bacterium]|nr:hypothetical protein [Candidatus Saccharibacteria bacterium]